MLRKIKRRDEVRAKKRKNQIIAGVVLIGLLVVSTAGYAFFGNRGEDETKIEYNDFKG